MAGNALPMRAIARAGAARFDLFVRIIAGTLAERADNAIGLSSVTLESGAGGFSKEKHVRLARLAFGRCPPRAPFMRQGRACFTGVAAIAAFCATIRQMHPMGGCSA